MSDTLDPIKLRVAGLPARGLNGRGNKQRLLVLVDRLREPLEQVKNEEETEVKKELGNGYDGSMKSEEIDIKEELIEPMQEPSDTEDRRGEERRAHSWSRSPDSKKQRPAVEVITVKNEPEYDRSKVILDWCGERKPDADHEGPPPRAFSANEFAEPKRGRFEERRGEKRQASSQQGPPDSKRYCLKSTDKHTDEGPGYDKEAVILEWCGGPPEKVPDLDPVVKIVEDVLSSDNVTIGGVSGIHEHDSEEDISEMKCLGESSSRQNFYSEQLPADEYCEEIPFEPDYVIELDSSLNRHPKRNVSIEPSSLVRNTQEVKPEGDFQSRVLTLMERAVEQQTLLLKEQRKMNQEQREVNRKLYEDQRRLTLSVAKMCESVVKMALSVAKMCESVVKMALSVAKSCESVEKMGLSVATSCESVEKMALSVAKSCESVEKMLEAVKAILKQKVPK
ncbi:golgin subfamily A member 6-like protein 25 isoform X3 [Macrobrachium rosenbergii]|uniref:golgin subfamily A member 6-like protein 25 isoform X3 n=1 Tax=Macrobrachium rosenbergii TaxID=79674 RepID=UPI0034D6BB0A